MVERTILNEERIFTCHQPFKLDNNIKANICAKEVQQKLETGAANMYMNPKPIKWHKL